MPARNILSTLPYAAAIIFSLSAPAAFAAGEETDATKPPETTETTTVCTDGKIWDAEKKECAEAATPATPVQSTDTAAECKDGKVFDFLSRKTPTGGADYGFIRQILRGATKVGPSL